jgi:hypothetical protein
MEIDLGAEKLICAEKGIEKIVVEVKSFLSRSLTYEFFIRPMANLESIVVEYKKPILNVFYT